MVCDNRISIEMPPVPHCVKEMMTHAHFVRHFYVCLFPMA